MAPAEITFSPRRAVQPDVLVIPLINGRQPARLQDVRRLLLAVEVLSPSTVRADRYIKRRLYLSEGVDEYWIVEPEARLVERWRPGDEEPEVLVDTIVWAPDAEDAGLVINLPAYFRRVHGEPGE